MICLSLSLSLTHLGTLHSLMTVGYLNKHSYCFSDLLACTADLNVESMCSVTSFKSSQAFRSACDAATSPGKRNSKVEVTKAAIG